MAFAAGVLQLLQQHGSRLDEIKFQWPLRPECCNSSHTGQRSDRPGVSMAFAAGVLQHCIRCHVPYNHEVSMAFAAGVLQQHPESYPQNHALASALRRCAAHNRRFA